jgi:hypothetical protein
MALGRHRDNRQVFTGFRSRARMGAVASNPSISGICSIRPTLTLAGEGKGDFPIVSRNASSVSERSLLALANGIIIIQNWGKLTRGSLGQLHLQGAAMGHDGLEELTARVAFLEKIVPETWKRLFMVERKLLIGGTIFTVAELLPGQEEQSEIDSLKLIAESLSDVSPEFKLRLKDLDKDEGECCPMLPGIDPEDQTLS